MMSGLARNTALRASLPFPAVSTQYSSDSSSLTWIRSVGSSSTKRMRGLLGGVEPFGEAVMTLVPARPYCDARTRDLSADDGISCPSPGGYDLCTRPRAAGGSHIAPKPAKSPHGSL